MHDDLLEGAFRRFDVENTGFITVVDLKEVLGSDFTNTEIQSIIGILDKNNDGKIGLTEFVGYLKGEAGDTTKETASSVLQRHGMEIGRADWVRVPTPSNALNAITPAGPKKMPLPPE